MSGVSSPAATAPARAPGHAPVLLAEVLEALEPRAGALYVDGTFGAGGYTRALLAAADCRVIALDRDPDAIDAGAALAAEHGDRLRLMAGRFGDMATMLREQGIATVDGVALDVGVSSMQLDRAERGFAFAHDGPLDMRMAQEGPSAADLVNAADEAELADIIYTFGEERLSRRIARAIVAARAEAPITRTGQLADIVRRAVDGAVRAPRRKGVIDPATRTFQAIRIHVNDELGELARGLVAAETLLRPGGRLVVVSFHSLEDRQVKAFLRARSGAGAGGSRHLPATPPRRRPPSFRLLSRRAIKPGAAEIAANPRARSARLRAAVRTDAPAWGANGDGP